MMEENKRSLYFRLTIVSLSILLLGSFWLTMRMAAEPVNLVVKPVVPREDEPIVATFKLNNPSPQALLASYQFYANGELLTRGSTTIAPASCETYQYAYENPLRLGEQLNFVVRTQSEYGNYQRAVSLPSYPPQIWSSFVSFASFSTTVMSSMSTMTYYQTAFVSDLGFNVGFICAVVLIALLIFLELSKPVVDGRMETVLGRLIMRFSTVVWLLFIIVMGVVYTTVMIITST